MKRNITLLVLAIFSISLASADNQLVNILKERICDLSREPFFQTTGQHDLAVSISNKGNTTDLSLRELYWNTYQDDADLDQIMQSQQPDGSWKEIKYDDRALSNWSPVNHVSMLLYLSRAYITPASKYYHQPVVSDVLHRGLNYWFRTKPVCKNWWYNEIGVPRFMGLVFLFLEKELTPVEKSEALVVMNHSGFRMTGQNKVWLAGNVLMKALLLNDEKLAKEARDTIATEIYTTTKEGIQPDYSFHQHGPQQQFGNYGLAFISSMAYYASIFGGTSVAFSSEQVSILRNYIQEGENLVMWKGYLDVSACNRQLFKKAQMGKALALCVAVNELKQVDSTFSTSYDDILKRNLAPGTLSERTMSKHFWRSDLTVFRDSACYISVRACSPRVQGTEFTNNENKKGHFISDGSTIFMRRGNEYADIFPFWDWNRLPGVTAPVLDTVIPHPATDDYHNPNPFVGGLTRDANGISTFHLARNQMDAKKSWFKLHGVLVCLGAGIQTKTGAEIITGVNQCLQAGPGFITSRNEKTIATEDTLWTSDKISSVWHDSIGYYFPKRISTTVSLQQQSGNWHDIADPYSSERVSGRVFKLWLNHGVNAAAFPAYEYVVLPSVSVSGLKNFVQKPDIDILANNSSVQAVKRKDNSLFQFVFYEPGRMRTFSKKDFVEVKTPGLVMLERDFFSNLVITVADPTQNLSSARLIVGGKYAGEQANYNSADNQTELDIPLPRGGEAGKSISIELKRLN